MKGDSRVKQDYEKNGVYVGEDGREYYVVVAEYPEATEEELYGNMFAVYSNSKYLARSMEVITYLNTNQELRNLLQYGIQGQHYEFNENGTVKLLHDAKYGIYSMDIEKTGNCFIASPTEEMGVDAWTYAKLQNNDSLINPLLGFDFNQAIADSDYSIDTVLIDEIKRLNAETLAQIEECSNKDDLMSLMSDATDGLIVQHDPIKTPNEKLEKAINSLYDPDTANDKSGNSPYAVYYTWLTTYGYLYTPSVED